MKIYFSSLKIKMLRESLGMSQRAFGSSLGVPQTTVFRWESGLSKPSANYIARLLELASENDIEFLPFVYEQSDKDDVRLIQR